MDASLLIDHQPPGAASSPDGHAIRALLTISGVVPADRQRPPIALAVVIDRSGSMGGDRIISARTAAARAVERLHPDDVVSAVAFDDAIDIVAAPQRRSTHHALVQQLQSLEPGGSTNLSGGWLRGRQDMEQAKGMLGTMPGSTRRVVILTDGHANAGITDTETLVGLARTARASGITTTTVGIGEGYDDALLRSMADAGGGNSWYIERPDQSEDVLAEELGNLLSVAAQGLTVTLTLQQAVSVRTVHSNWPVTQTGDGIYRFDLGDLYASEPKPLLVELTVPVTRLGELAAGTLPVATLTIEADVLTSEGGVEHRVVQLPIASTLEDQSQMVPAIEHAVLLARTAKAREDAARLQREGDAPGAEQAMQQAFLLLTESSLQRDDRYSAELRAQARDLERMGQRYRARQYGELEAKYQMQRSYNARRGKHQYDVRLSRKEED